MRLIVLAALVWAGVPFAARSAEPHGLSAAARAILGADQGVYIEAADGTVLLAQLAEKPVHPASVSKVPTTLALLRKLGPEHRFVTTYSTDGRVVGGTLYGDLWVESDGDPSLVDEDALLVAERLKDEGIERIAGNLRSRAPLTFDWRSEDDLLSMRKALAGLTPPAAWIAVRALELESAPAPMARPWIRPGIQFVNTAAAPLAVAAPGVSAVRADRVLVVHRSQPLLSLVKSLNDYSNNIFKPLAAAAGGATAVESVARSAVPETMHSEIVLGDGAGTDPRNRLSPRAAVKLLRALEKELALSGHELFDVLPVAGIDDGTLRDRLNAPGEAGHVLGKTGTYGDYGASALIGAIPTTDLGTVYFAILNHGVPVPVARRRQDQFIRALLLHLHSRPWNYQRDVRPAVMRAQVSIVPG